MSTTAFLDLPPELRNTIYKNVLLKDRRIRITDLKSQNPRVGFDEPGILNLHTTKAKKAGLVIREEALPIYYGGNKFLHWFRCPLLLSASPAKDLSNSDDFFTWMRFLGEEKQLLLKDVRCMIPSYILKEGKAIFAMRKHGLQIDEKVVQFKGYVGRLRYVSIIRCFKPGGCIADS